MSNIRQDFRSLIRLMRLTGKHLFAYLVSTFGVSARNLFIHLLNALLFSRIVSAAQQGSGHLLVKGVLDFVLLLAVFVAADTFFIFMQTNTLSKIENSLKATLLTKILHAPMREVDAVGRRSELVTRINSDVKKAKDVYGNAVVYPLLGLISGAGSLFVLVKINAWLLLWAVFLGVLDLLFDYFAGRRGRRLSLAQQENKAGLLTSFSELFRHGVGIRMMGLSGMLQGRFRKKVSDFDRLNRSDAALSGVSTGFHAFGSTMRYMGTILLGFLLFAGGKMELKDILVAAQMVGLLTGVFTSIGGAFASLQRALAGVSRIFALVDMGRERTGHSAARADAQTDVSMDRSVKAQTRIHAHTDVSAHMHPLIEIRHAAMTYDNRKWVFRDLSGDIPAHAVTVLTGASGRGKSTLMKALLGLYPYTGSIRLRGKELSAYGVDELRAQIAYVPQRNLIVEGSIAHNLLLDAPRLSIGEERLWEALKVTCLYDFVKSLPRQLETPLHAVNTALSGGQRQCIGIARALLSEKEILFFDEAFSAMDVATRSGIRQNLKRYIKGRTVLAISHDDTLVKERLAGSSDHLPAADDHLRKYNLQM